VNETLGRVVVEAVPAFIEVAKAVGGAVTDAVVITIAVPPGSFRQAANPRNNRLIQHRQDNFTA
jgi:hypothetical protein